MCFLFTFLVLVYNKYRQFQNKIHSRRLNPYVTEFFSKCSTHLSFSSDARFVAAMDEQDPLGWLKLAAINDQGWCLRVFQFLVTYFHLKTTCVTLEPQPICTCSPLGYGGIYWILKRWMKITIC